MLAARLPRACGVWRMQVTRNMPFILYWGQRLCSPLFLLYQKTAPAGAYTTVHVATAPNLRGTGGRCGLGDILVCVRRAQRDLRI
jgi:hypothetical protein